LSLTSASSSCWPSSAHLRRTVEECEPRDLRSLRQRAARAASVPGCEEKIDPRGLRVPKLRALIAKLGGGRQTGLKRP